MKLKLYGGTAKGDENLCRTCRNSHRVRYATSNEEITVCTVGDGSHVVPAPVAECSSYRREGEPSLYDMKPIAWHISADKRSGKIGFLDPKAAKRAEKDGKLDRDFAEPEEF